MRRAAAPLCVCLCCYSPLAPTHPVSFSFLLLLFGLWLANSLLASGVLLSWGALIQPFLFAFRSVT